LTDMHHEQLRKGPGRWITCGKHAIGQFMGNPGLGQYKLKQPLEALYIKSACLRHQRVVRPLNASSLFERAVIDVNNTEVSCPGN
jgi:hypothetical protein